MQLGHERSLELSLADSVSASGATDLPARNRNFKLRKEYRKMILTNMYRVMVWALIFGALVAVAPSTFAQESNQPARTSAQKDEDVNLDTQLYLILATNRDVEDARMPSRSEERRVGKSVDLGGRRIIKKKKKKEADQHRKRDNKAPANLRSLLSVRLEEL